MNRSAFNKSSTGFQQIPKRNHKIKIKTRKNPVSMPIYKISPKAAKSPDHNSDSKGQRFESPRPHQTPRSASKRGGAFFVKKQVPPLLRLTRPSAGAQGHTPCSNCPKNFPQKPANRQIRPRPGRNS